MNIMHRIAAHNGLLAHGALAAVMLAVMSACGGPAEPLDSSSETAVNATASACTFCGGIAAIACPEGAVCRLDGSYPDAGGCCIGGGPEVPGCNVQCLPCAHGEVCALRCHAVGACASTRCTVIASCIPGHHFDEHACRCTPDTGGRAETCGGSVCGPRDACCCVGTSRFCSQICPLAPCTLE